MGEKSVIIVGAGLSGLAAGCYCQMNGYRTQILEHSSQPGGVAAWWRRGEFTVEGGIHFLMGHRPHHPMHKLYRELGTARQSDVADMQDYATCLDQVSGQTLTISPDLDRFVADVRVISPSDTPIVQKLVNAARKLSPSVDMDTTMAVAPEMSTPWTNVKMLWEMRGILGMYRGEFNQTMESYAAGIVDPWLRRVVTNLFLPEVPVWFVAMVLAMLEGKRTGLLLGGSEGFVRPIEQRYLDLGGAVRYKATVAKVLVENGRAIGVKLTDGSSQRADYVICTADGQSTIFDLLGGRYVDETTRRRYAEFPLIKPSCLINYGVARELADWQPFSVAFLAEPILLGEKRIDAIFLRVFNYTPRLAPQGKTLLQVTFEDEWSFWKELRERDLAAYYEQKKDLAEQVLARLDGLFPGIAAQVEMTDVSTPWTTWRYTRNREGAYMGWLPTPKAIVTPFKRTLPGLSSFVMAGQWVMPGGGVPPCIYSGRHAAQILCKWDKKPFQTSEAY